MENYWIASFSFVVYRVDKAGEAAVGKVTLVRVWHVFIVDDIEVRIERVVVVDWGGLSVFD